MTAAFRNRKIDGHTCVLQEDEDCIVRFIDSGILVPLRRILKKWTMVNSAHPHSKKILKSTTQIRLEEARHLQKYYYMIHPFSKFRIFWENVMIIVYTLLFIIVPVEFAAVTLPVTVTSLKLSLDIIWCIDMILWFCTGYYHKETQKIIMEAKLVAKHYILTNFVFDLFSVLSINSILLSLRQYDETIHLRFRHIKFLLILKLTRVPTLFRYINNFFERRGIWSYGLKIINFSMSLFIVFWWASGIYLHIKTNLIENPDSVSSQALAFLQSCYRIIVPFMLVSLGSKSSTDGLEIMFQVSCLICGSILNIFLMAQIMQIYNTSSSASKKSSGLVQQIKEYMNYKELPSNLWNKVSNYVDYKFHKSMYKEEKILNSLSSLIKQDILLHNCQRLVERVEFFKNLPQQVLVRIVSKLKSEIYLPNDVIVQAGISGNAMYFIYMGTVVVYTSTGKEVCHLDDGGHFGEISIIINEPRVANVIALSDCEVFRLSRKDFQEAIQPYPDLAAKIRTLAVERLEKTLNITQMEDEDDLTP